MASPIFLKPLLEDGDCFKQQTNDIKNYFRQAFRIVNLDLPTQEQDGIAISGREITTSLVERIFKANVVIIDANPYSDIATFPWLYYCVGISQSLQNHTILIGRSLDHLPVSLRKQHALSYDTDKPADFFDLFEQAIRSILGGQITDPDNPIQEYLRHKKMETELQKLKMESQAKEAQIKELEQRTKIDQKSPTSITFRKVNP